MCSKSRDTREIINKPKIKEELMNYKIGDIVHEKGIPKSARTNGYIFLGTDNTTKTSRQVKEVCGKDIDIGLFIGRPVDICYHQDIPYARILERDVELFEI